MMSENMGLHPSMMGYSQGLGGMPAAGTVLLGSTVMLQSILADYSSARLSKAQSKKNPFLA